MKEKEEEVNINGIIKFNIEEEATTTIITTGNKKWKLTRHMLDKYVLMSDDGKIADFDSSYRKAYEKSLQLIYDTIITDINKNFNILINREDR